jgi:hypothetical protein
VPVVADVADVETADETATAEEIVAEDAAPAPEAPADADVEAVVEDAATDATVIQIESEATPES